MFCSNSPWIIINTDSIYKCYFNCNFDSASLPNPVGCFNYGCDGVEKLIYSSTIPNPILTFNIKNTGSCSFDVSLIKLENSITSTLNYTVTPGQPLTLTNSNITDIYITCASCGILNNCYYNPSCGSPCNKIGCKICSGNYTIIM